MFTITRNLAMDRLRHHARYHDGDFSELEFQDEFSFVENTGDRMVLETVLTRLTEEERRIVMLHAVSGLKHREIASSLNIPLSTVLSKYKRSLKKLRTYLAEMEVVGQ